MSYKTLMMGAIINAVVAALAGLLGFQNAGAAFIAAFSVLYWMSVASNKDAPYNKSPQTVRREGKTI